MAKVFLELNDFFMEGLISVWS